MRVSAIASLLSAARQSVESTDVEPSSQTSDATGLVPSVHYFARRPATPSYPLQRGGAKDAVSSRTSTAESFQPSRVPPFAPVQGDGTATPLDAVSRPGSAWSETMSALVRPPSAASWSSDGLDEASATASRRAMQASAVAHDSRPRSLSRGSDSSVPTAATFKSTAADERIALTVEHLVGAARKLAATFGKLDTCTPSSAHGGAADPSAIDPILEECTAIADEFVAAISVAHRLVCKETRSGTLSTVPEALARAQSIHSAAAVQLHGCIQRFTPTGTATHEGSILSLAKLCSLAFHLFATNAIPINRVGDDTSSRPSRCLFSAARVLYFLTQDSSNDTLLKASQALARSTDLLRSLQAPGADGCSIENSGPDDSERYTTLTPSVLSAQWLEASPDGLHEFLETVAFIVGAWKHLTASLDNATYFASQGGIPAAAGLAAGTAILMTLPSSTDAPPALIAAAAREEKALMQLAGAVFGLFRTLAAHQPCWAAMQRAHISLIALACLGVPKMLKYTEFVDLAVRLVSKSCQRPDVAARFMSSVRFAGTTCQPRPVVKQLVHVLGVKRNHPMLASRILYTLGVASRDAGNMDVLHAIAAGAATDADKAANAGIHLLGTLLDRMASSLLDAGGAGGDGTDVKGTKVEIEEACSKLLRVLANLAATPTLAPAICAHAGSSRIGPLMELACQPSDAALQVAHVDIRNELLLTCLGFVTNVSYGCDPDVACRCCEAALAQLATLPAGTALSVQALHLPSLSSRGFPASVPALVFCLASVLMETGLRVAADDADAASGTMLKGIALECLRALSNLMRGSPVRVCLHTSLFLYDAGDTTGMHQFLIAVASLLVVGARAAARNLSDMDVTYTTAGLLVNVCRDAVWKQSMRRTLHGVAPSGGDVAPSTALSALILLLKEQWQQEHPSRTRCITVCLQALCNYARGWEADVESEQFRFDDAQAVELLQVVSSILEEVGPATTGQDAGEMAVAAAELQAALKSMVDEGAVLVSEDD